MAIEQSLLDQLFRYARRPNLWQAKQCLEIPEIQDVALRVASLMREQAIEINTRRREIEKLPPLNWRDFLVGSLTIGVAPARDGGYNWFASAAWNTKPHQNQEKFCAERRNGRRLVRRGCVCFVGIATVAELNKNGDDRSGFHGPGPTLDMCEACRDDVLGEFRDQYCPETLVVNEHPVTRVRSKPRTLPQVFEHHREVYWGRDSKVIALSKGGR